MKRDVKKTARTVTRWVGSVQSIVLHTLVFAGSFTAVYFGVFSIDRMLLVLTTLVSLEAIYLAIFIQMTINQQTETIEEVESDIDEIQGDIDEIQEDVEEMSEEEETEAAREIADHQTLEEIRAGLQRMMKEIEALQKRP